MSAFAEFNTVVPTHRGLVRAVNEDRYYVQRLGADAMLLAMMDGMGGGRPDRPRPRPCARPCGSIHARRRMRP